MTTAMTIPGLLCAAACSLAGTPPVVDDYVIDDGTFEGQIVYEDDSSSTILRIANRFTVLERREHALIAWVSPVYGESSHFGIEDVRLHLDGDGDGRPDHATNPIWSYKGVASNAPPTVYFIELADGTKGYRIPSQFLGDLGDTFFLEVVIEEHGQATALYDVNVPQPIAAPPPVPSIDCTPPPGTSDDVNGDPPVGNACGPGTPIDLNHYTDVPVDPIGFVRFEGEPWTSILEHTGHNGVFGLRLEANTIEYALDDGDGETLVNYVCPSGCSYDTLLLHAYEVAERSEVLTTLTFAHPPDNGSATVTIWEDPNNDGDPSDVDAVDSVIWTAGFSFQDTEQLDEHITIDLPDVVAGEPGDRFFVGVTIPAEGESPFVARGDQSGKLHTGVLMDTFGTPKDPVDPADAEPVSFILFGQISWVIRVEAIPRCPTDLTRDGVIDNLDLNAVLTALNTQPYPWTGADATGDGLVDSDDLAEVLKAFGAACP